MLITKVVAKPAPAVLPGKQEQHTADVHCLICSHRVPAQVLVDRRGARVKPGEKCVRCGSNLDSGCVVAIRRAA